MRSAVLAAAIVIAAAAVASLLVVPEQPVLGLGLGALAAVIILVAPAAHPPGGRPVASRTRLLTRRSVLVSAVALVVGGAELYRRSLLSSVIREGASSPRMTPAAAPPHATQTPSTSPLEGIWLSPDEIAALPTDTDAFRRLEEAASEDIRHEDISNQDSSTPTHLMQVALVAARRNDSSLRSTARETILKAIGTENGDTGGHQERNRPLGVGRNLPAYVIAADLIGLRTFDRSADDRFRSWLDQLRSKRLEGADWSLAEIEPLDHSNWGAYMSAAMTAANLYLDDAAAIQSSAHMLRGWLGDPDGRQDWLYDTDRHDYSWMCHYPDVDRFVPVNPAGCEREGMDIGGIIPIDMQRGGGFRVPPRYTQYPRESLQGRTVQAELLFRAGYDTWEWADRALLRIAERQLAMAEEFDRDWYEPHMGCYWIISRRTGLELPLEEPSTGRAVAGVDWTHVPA